MYKFICPNNHSSYSASKDGTDPACPTCGEPTQLVSQESLDKPTPKVES